LANVLLTALDERYGRWTPKIGEPPSWAQKHRAWDRQKGRPTFFMVRYADDFVILVTGSQEEAEAEKAQLATFLKEQLHLELSMEKTLITRAEDGFDFLGYRVIKEPAMRTGRMVCKLRIPKGKLQLLRDRIRERTKCSTTLQSLENLLRLLNPLIAGWRNYYRYAVGASREFSSLDWWMLYRIHGWLRKKHPKATNKALYRKFAKREIATRWTWGEGEHCLQRFGQDGTARYPRRGVRISNGWNDEIDGFRQYTEQARPISGLLWTGALL
jgi:hypothetical protein